MPTFQIPMQGFWQTLNLGHLSREIKYFSLLSSILKLYFILDIDKTSKSTA
jgi:hypothetical protein